ncbi:hypothetical protein BU15DRAFT_46631 [Melanogaster broomeanus]|nr:hypothetical protein BU15DRAFT_46631 [Melanogaster broomeanus]
MATPEDSKPHSCKCTTTTHLPSRNMVVCIDGTSNHFGTKNTNIVELYSQIVKNDMQPSYYASGIGTLAKIAGASDHSNWIDMAVGRNLHSGIMAAYRWLSDNYRDGDKIYLFGKIFKCFSRGAYQVRALAGMIARVGLLLPGNNEQIPFAFELYSKTDDDEPSKRASHTELAERFKKTFCRENVQIHFVGVWDTVSSVGFGRSKTLPCTTSSCEHIRYFRHALALDERRVNFLPEYAFGGRSNIVDDDHIKEVWFAGTHSDLQSGDIPLQWMRSQAIAAGLDLKPADVMWKVDDLEKEITPSLDLPWWLLELLPIKHLLYCNSDKQTYRWVLLPCRDIYSDRQQTSFRWSAENPSGAESSRVSAVQEQLQALRAILW